MWSTAPEYNISGDLKWHMPRKNTLWQQKKKKKKIIAFRKTKNYCFSYLSHHLCSIFQREVVLIGCQFRSINELSLFWTEHKFGGYGHTMIDFGN